MKKFRLLKSPVTIGLALFMVLMSGTTALAAIPDGTLIFGNGQALDLNYANNPANIAEVTQDVLSGGSIYVILFSGQVINNNTGAALTDLSVLPAVTYKDQSGKETNYAAGDGAEVVSSDNVVATVSSASFGSNVNVSIQNPVNLVNAANYQVYDTNGNAISSITALDSTTTVYPAVQTGGTVEIQFYAADKTTKVGTMQTVTLQTSGSSSSNSSAFMVTAIN